MRLAVLGSIVLSAGWRETPLRAWVSAVSLFAAMLVPVQSMAADNGPVKVNAAYSIAFVGIKIGHFGFQSDIGAKNYHLTSTSGVKLLFGAFKWNSHSTVQGVLAPQPTPNTFEFNYRIKKKEKRSSVFFKGGDAIKVQNYPPENYSPDEVPVKSQHLSGVIDPLTAIMRMTTASEGDACRQTAEIFDGRRRLKLSLSPKGRRTIKEKGRSGQPAFGYVCRIKFTPVAGHKKGNDINYIASNNDMEIVLRPVPAAGLLVPYQILIPTSFGTVAIAAQSISIVDARNSRIAMQY